MVIGPSKAKKRINDDELEKMLSEALKNTSVRDASTEIAKITGFTRREVYSRAIALTQKKR